MSPLVRALMLLALLPVLGSSAEPITNQPTMAQPEQSSPPAQPNSLVQPNPPVQPGPQTPSSPPQAATPSPPPGPGQPAVTAKTRKLTAAEEYAKEMKSCMEAWDSFTRMTRVEWRQTCQRTLKMRAYQFDIR